MRQIKAAIAIAIGFMSVSGCGKDGGAAVAWKPLEIAPTGMIVDAPEGWKVTTEMEGFYTVEGPTRRSGSVQLMATPGMPATLDEAVASRCADQTDIVKEQLPSGLLYVQCKGPSKAIQVEGKTFITTKIVAYLPGLPDDEALKCHYETDQDPATIARICKSMRKK